MKKLVMIGGLLLILGSCYNDKYDKLYPASGTTCDTTTITYTHDIQPIVAQYCAINGGCHNASGNASTGNLDFTILSVLRSQATTDLMLNDIMGTPTRSHNAMPLNLPAIPTCDINKITRWVNQGAQP